ncbi:MAG TPA: hypothetical protein VF450_05455 [Noviherbaspirillum sp.]
MKQQSAAVPAPVVLPAGAMPMDRPDFTAYVKACIKEVVSLLREQIAVPAGHEWKLASLALLLKRDDPIRSTMHGAAVQIGRVWPDERDPKQYMIDIHYYWQERILLENGKSQTIGKPRHQVSLWCEKGRPLWGKLQNLLPEEAPLVLCADAIPELAQIVAQTVNRATGQEHNKQVSPATLQ